MWWIFWIKNKKKKWHWFLTGRIKQKRNENPSHLIRTFHMIKAGEISELELRWNLYSIGKADVIGEKSNRICIVLYSVWHDSCTDPALCRAGDFSDPVISFFGISSVLLLENVLWVTGKCVMKVAFVYIEKGCNGNRLRLPSPHREITLRAALTLALRRYRGFGCSLMQSFFDI